MWSIFSKKISVVWFPSQYSGKENGGFKRSESIFKGLETLENIWQLEYDYLQWAQPADEFNK